MVFIDSKENEHYKLWRSLRTRKYRERFGDYILEGEKTVREAFREGIHVKAILVTDTTEAYEFLEKAPVYCLKQQLYRELSDLETPPEIMAIAEMTDGGDYPDKNDFRLIVDGVQDPGNLGSIIRSADAYGLTHIYLLKGTVDYYHPRVIRASMGSFMRVRPVTPDNTEAFLQEVKDAGFTLVATDLKAARLIHEIRMEHAAYVLGSEGKGVSETVLKAADARGIIPMPGRTESLNVAAAAAILLYEREMQKVLANGR